MNGIFSNLGFVLKEIWGNIGIAQRISIILICLVGATAVGVVMYMGTRPNWQVLYADLNSETASQIYELVRDENVPVKLKDSGRTIMVPYESMNDLRLKVTQSGVQVDQKGVGLELFDNVKLGLTEMQQRVGYQRAIQGELQRIISEMPGVAQTRVMIVIPRRRVLQSSNKSGAKASVFLIMKKGHSLGQDQIAGIRHLVSGAIDGINPSDVTIADNTGRLLARGAGMNGDGSSSQHLEIRRQMEGSLREKAEAVLRPIVGVDAVIAMVTVDLDFNTVEKLKEEYDNTKTVVVQERVISEENSTSGGRRAGGVAGTGSNLISVRNPESGGSGQDQETRKTMENSYLVPKTTERTKLSGPRIKGISAAVTISRKKSVDGGEGAESVARTPEEMDQFKQLVISAIGADLDSETRKDSVTVVEGEFLDQYGSFDAKEAVKAGLLHQIEPLVNSPLVRPVAGLLMLGLLYWIFGSTFKKDQIERMDLGGSHLNNGVMALETQDALSNNLPAALEGSSAQAAPVEKVKTKTKTDPNLVINALETWLTEG